MGKIRHENGKNKWENFPFSWKWEVFPFSWKWDVFPFSWKWETGKTQNEKKREKLGNVPDLYDLMKSGIVGGPSIIFKRYVEAGKTYIRNGEKVCKKAVGYDANAYIYGLFLNGCLLVNIIELKHTI